MGFGRSMREHFLLDPTITYLNHGTVGSTPVPILEAQRAIRDQIERQPARFLFRELFETVPPQTDGRRPALRHAADRVGAFVGASSDDLVFVDNATAGVNAILRSFPFEPGDTVAITSYGYGSFPSLLDYVAQQRGIRVHTVPLPFPAFDPDVLFDAFVAGLPPSTRMVMVDHIASNTGVLFPIERIVAHCRAEGILVLVDGAHAPGNVPLDLTALDADFYVGNLHKWMWTPRSSAILHVRPSLQSSVRPTVLSWGADNGFTSAFDLAGTRDPSNHLCAPAAIDLMESIGVEAIQTHNNALAEEAVKILATRWGTHGLSSAATRTSMCAVELPARLNLNATSRTTFRDALLDHHQIELHVAGDAERSWVRVACQVYNDLEDLERLAEVVASA